MRILDYAQAEIVLDDAVDGDGNASVEYVIQKL
jgi:hypothetical protein